MAETDKERVVNRLLDICECEGKLDRCDSQGSKGIGWFCSREPNHEGRHWACIVTEHKIYEWD